ncbi:MAG: hypothetical protein DHS20C18_19140 [Saprospiraceae bacterium]|nr:MAG: hypothetical protein DHS20C18_19140 [Saprospiraceae bacterium]
MLRMVFFYLALAFPGFLTAQLVIAPGSASGEDPVELVRESCFGPGIEVVDFEFEGVPASIGLFSGGEEIIGLDQGFIMTTGNAATQGDNFGADAPTFEMAMVNNLSLVEYPGLAPLISNQPTRDVAIIRFKFIPLGNNVVFRYVFASEEYPEYVCSNFNDVFGFFLTGPETADGPISTINIAKVPGTDLPVSINSINSGIPGTQPVVDPAFCDGPLGSLDHANLFNFTQGGAVYDGHTDVFTATAQVVPCQEYVMELVLADVGDPFWDSGLFFEAKSFCSPLTGVVAGVEAQSPVLIEGCGQNPIGFTFNGYDSTDFPMSFRIEGDAIQGLDYLAQTNGTVEGPQFELPIDVLSDQEIENPEAIRIIFDVTDCLQDTVTFYIVDALEITGVDQIICDQGPLDLNLVTPPDSPDLSSDWVNNLSLLWSTGDSTAAITVTPEETTTYTLAYANDVNNCATEFTIAVGDPIVEVGGPLCHNEDGIVVNGTLYDLNNPSGIEVFPGPSGCDSVVIVNFEPVASSDLNLLLCAGESADVNGTTYHENHPTGLEIISGATAEGCDSVVFVNLSFLPLDTLFFEGLLCAEESVEINGTIYDINHPSGEEFVSGGSDNGCNAVYRIFYDFYPVSESNIELTIEEGETITIGGTEYATAGTFQQSFTNQNGCDSLVKLTLGIATTTSIVTDSILVDESGEFCLDIGFLNSPITIVNGCENEGDVVDFSIEENQACITYTGNSPGGAQACIVACDDLTCDTTYIEISVFTNFLDAVDDLDSTVYGQPVDVDVLANDWTSETTIINQYLVQLPTFGTAEIDGDGSIGYFPGIGGCDREISFSYAICNEMGCDTAQVVVILRDTIDLCSAVWPGDVRPDGLVNIVDFWAVGLGFYKTGPVRPNASIVWEPQPASDWSQSITFIEAINLKHADCNGDGIVNPDDYEAIEANMGQTHDFAGEEEAFAKLAIPLSYQLNPKAYGEIVVDLYLGDFYQPIERISGLAFSATTHAAMQAINLDLDNGWLKPTGSEIYSIKQQDLDAGSAYFGLSRQANEPVSGWGYIGSLRLRSVNDLGILQLSDIKILLNGTEIYRIDPILIDLSPLSTGIDPILLSDAWSIFPNPVENILFVETEVPVGTYTLTLQNMQGVNLRQLQIDEVRYALNVSDLPAGVYIVKIQSGKQMCTKKVLVR